MSRADERSLLDGLLDGRLSVVHTVAASLALLTLAATGCSGDNTGTSDDMDGSSDMEMIRCSSNEVLNPQTNTCQPFFPDMGGVDGDMSGGGDGGDSGVDDLGTIDEEDLDDMAIDLGPDPNCMDTLVYRDDDLDGRGVDDANTNQMICLTFEQDPPEGFARSAGDCNDQDSAINPSQPEICDDKDNDCDGNLNQGIACEFFVHSREELYRIDPFKLTISFEGMIDTPDPLLDIDTHPDGRLFGISARSLFVYEYDTNQDLWDWREVGSLQESLQGANGLAIDRFGKAFATARNEIYEIDIETGRASAPGVLMGNVFSSGDCVINKGNSLFMTSKDTASGSDRNDELVSVNATNNTTRVIGLTNHQRIYGLTAAWGRLYGVTSGAELIEIDQGTGASTLLKKFNNVSTFYGAASSPSR